MGGFKICGVHVDLHQRRVDRMAETHSGSGGVLKAAFVVHYAIIVLGLCRNFRRPRVVFRKHNCHARRRSNEQEFDYENRVPRVVQWCMPWVSAPTRLRQTLENQGIELAKYHEAVNMAIAYAISRPFGGAHTPRSCMLTTVAAVLYKTPK